MIKRVMIIAGEASGDMYGARLVEEVRKSEPDFSFFGIGGQRMREAGVDILVDSSEMAVVGLVEVIAHFGVIRRAFMKMREVIRHDPPDLLILIDYPDFNLLIARLAKKAGVKMLYYISPQVWAWRSGRVRTIARLVDHMAVVFPFELPIYESAGVPVTFVGHPLVDMVRPSLSREEAKVACGLDCKRLTVGLFPGSRRGEVSRLLPVILETARILRGRFPELQFILPVASTLSHEFLQQFISGCGLEIQLVEGRAHDVIQASDAIVAVSGTVTTEIALLEVPMVIIYKVSPLTYLVGKRLINVEHIGICNLVSGERIVPELTQSDAVPEKISDELSRIFTDSDYAETMQNKLHNVRRLLGDKGASIKVAALAIELACKGSCP